MGLGQTLLKNRKRFAPVIAAVAVVVIGSTLAGVAPRKVTLRLNLGPAHEAVSGMDIALLQDGEEVRSARFGFGEGAPRTVRYEAWLAPGRYELTAVVRGGGHAREHSRPIVVSSGMGEELRVDVFEVAMAMLSEAHR